MVDVDLTGGTMAATREAQIAPGACRCRLDLPDRGLAGPDGQLVPPPGQSAHHVEALSRGEARVLRYLQTNLSARELSTSVNTVKTHQRHLYQKLGAQPHPGR